VILAESSQQAEPQLSNIPPLGEYEDYRRQLQEVRRMDYRQHLAAVCDATALRCSDANANRILTPDSLRL